MKKPRGIDNEKVRGGRSFAFRALVLATIVRLVDIDRIRWLVVSTRFRRNLIIIIVITIIVVVVVDGVVGGGGGYCSLVWQVILIIEQRIAQQRLQRRNLLILFLQLFVQRSTVVGIAHHCHNGQRQQINTILLSMICANLLFSIAIDRLDVPTPPTILVQKRDSKSHALFSTPKTINNEKLNKKTSNKTFA
jgi:hypothetical protein